MDNKCLVIGATGSIGSPLVQYLVEKGESIKAATRTPENYLAQTNVEPVYFDYDKPETLTSALERVNRVFMITKPNDPEPDKTLNPFIDKAQRAGVRHIVLVTALGVERAGDELGYRRVEKHLMASGIDYTILRPGWFMQSFISGFILSTIKQRNSIYLPAANAKISLIDSRDIAAVGAAALTEAGHKGKEYTLTGGEALNFVEIAEILSQVTQCPIEYVNVSTEELNKIVSEVGGYPGPLEIMERFFQSVRKGTFALISPAVSEVLGRDPINFEQFVRENATLWKSKRI
jgi:uncharacterized protein YbjT (DUF2867 family)